MKHLDVGAQIRTVIAGLRWYLTDLRMSGLKDWLTHSMDGHGIPQADIHMREDVIRTTETLEVIASDLVDCHRCRLHAGRTQIVFGEGSPGARLIFVGEGPGYEEDQQGRPFVGKAGKLLDKMINAIGLERSQVYICNVVKCRPPNNRTPNPDEIQICSPFLFRQLEAIKPAVICALGACAAQTLIGTNASISSLRGKVNAWRGIPLICTYHPAYLLRNPAQKASSWHDLLIIRKILDQGEEIEE